MEVFLFTLWNDPGKDKIMNKDHFLSESMDGIHLWSEIGCWRSSYFCETQKIVSLFNLKNTQILFPNLAVLRFLILPHIDINFITAKFWTLGTSHLAYVQVTEDTFYQREHMTFVLLGRFQGCDSDIRGRWSLGNLANTTLLQLTKKLISVYVVFTQHFPTPLFTLVILNNLLSLSFKALIFTVLVS